MTSSRVSVARFHDLWLPLFGFALLSAALLGCSSSDPADDGGGGGDSGSGGTTSETAFPGDGVSFPKEATQTSLEEFLASGVYKSSPWRMDAAPRVSTDMSNPHVPKMRVFFNDVATAALEAGTTNDLPLGTFIIKEVYDNSDALIATLARYKDETGQGPVWTSYCSGPDDVCGLSNASAASFGFFAKGTNDCSNCHGGYVFAALPE